MSWKEISLFNSYSDDDEDLTSEEEGDVRLTGTLKYFTSLCIFLFRLFNSFLGTTLSGQQHDDEHDDDLDVDSVNTESDESHTGDELDDTEGPRIDIHIDTASNQSINENLTGNNERNQQTIETSDNINDDTTLNRNNEGDEDDDDDDDEDEDDEEERDEDEDDFAEDDDAGDDIEEMVER